MSDVISKAVNTRKLTITVIPATIIVIPPKAPNPVAACASHTIPNYHIPSCLSAFVAKKSAGPMPVKKRPIPNVSASKNKRAGGRGGREERKYPQPTISTL